MSERVAAIVPAKRQSRRVPDKNFRPFYKGLSLVELKVLSLQGAGISTIKISSDDPRAEGIAQRRNVSFEERPPQLCGDFVTISEWLHYSIGNWSDRVIYWAFATCPFVSGASVTDAIDEVRARNGVCVLGVQVLHEFLWSTDTPINYDPQHQPRSQDLAPLHRITGGIHMARGDAFIEAGALSFSPHHFVPLSLVESVDINTEEEWAFAVMLAEDVLRDL